MPLPVVRSSERRAALAATREDLRPPPREDVRAFLTKVLPVQRRIR